MNNQRSPKLNHHHPRPRPMVEYTYQGPLLFVLGLFLWALLGHIMIVVNQEESGALEYIYLLAAIVSAMALNNRWHGINHRIKFFSDYMVVPKLFNPWFWREETIYYCDIKEIKCYGEQGSTQAQMHVVTDGPIYPILNKKLQGVTLNQVKQHILDFAKSGHIASGQYNLPFEIAPSRQSGQKFLMVMAVFVSLITIAAIVSAGPYLSVLDGTRFFVMAAVLTFIQTTAMARLSSSTKSSSPNLDNAAANKETGTWHRRFLLGYLGVYGLIAWAFGLIAINGALDHRPAERRVVQVVNVDQRSDDDGPFCFEFTWADSVTSDGRLPAAAQDQGPAPRPLEALCRKGPALARQGEKLLLFQHRGALGEPWVSALAPWGGETVE